MSPLVVLLILLLFSCSPSSSVPIGSRDILRAIDIDSNTGPDLHDAAVDLNTTNFDQVLRNTPATYAIVEFFAHWSVRFLAFGSFVYANLLFIRFFMHVAEG